MWNLNYVNSQACVWLFILLHHFGSSFKAVLHHGCCGESRKGVRGRNAPDGFQKTTCGCRKVCEVLPWFLVTDTAYLEKAKLNVNFFLVPPPRSGSVRLWLPDWLVEAVQKEPNPRWAPQKRTGSGKGYVRSLAL